MNRLKMAALAVCLLLTSAARATTVVEILGRVTGTNLNSGPWVGVRAGEYFLMTFECVDGGTIVQGGCGVGMRRFALVPGSFHATTHNQRMDAPLAANGGGYLSPSATVANDCPVADVLMFEGANLALPGTGTTRYSMVFELHDSTGHLWNSSDIGQSLGEYGQGSFDYVEWNVSAPNLTTFSLQFLAMSIHAPGQGTGSCCLGDGGCAVTGANICSPGTWAADGDCSGGPCPPAGACCLGDGRCGLMTQAACEAIPNALYQGDGTSCATAACPPTSGCCLGGSCAVLNEQACLNSGGSWSFPTNGWLGTTIGCDVQPQYHHSVLANLPDATGTTTIVPGIFTDTINVDGQGTVQSVEVWLGMGLPRINDFRIRLTGPNGTTLDLVTRIGSTPPECTVTPIGQGYVMYDTLILQDAPPLTTQTFYQHVTSAPPGSLVSGGRYRPAGCGGAEVLLDAPSPAGFGGIPMAGPWTIEIRDERTGIRAYLNAWGLSFNGGGPPPCVTRCGSADFDCDGDTATDADIEAFFACLAGNCPAPPCGQNADFNGDGDSATDADIEAFFRVLAGGTC
jgi:subtilisin-like proprotein convertase family protein